MIKHYLHWVFDLDGTLTIHQHDFDQIRSELGIPAGVLILEYLEQLAPVDASRLRARLDALEAELVCAAQAAEGADDLLEWLSQRGVRCGILTRNTRANALNTLQGIGLARYFPQAVVIGREDCAPKPAPDGIHALLAAWGGAPATALMIGDFRLDLEAGRNAGTATMHIAPPTADHWPQLTDYRYASLRDLLTVLQATTTYA